MNANDLAGCLVKHNLKWFLFQQNNSGGYFDVDNKVCHRVFIQATNASEAEDIAEGLGIYFNGVDNGNDCGCCGDRWSSADIVELPVKYFGAIELTTVEEYAQYLADTYGSTTPDGRLFYKNGNVVDVNIQ